jgi:hypothetical protein
MYGVLICTTVLYTKNKHLKCDTKIPHEDNIVDVETRRVNSQPKCAVIDGMRQMIINNEIGMVLYSRIGRCFVS